MFTDEQLEEILTDPEVMKVPCCYKYAVIRAIEKILEREDQQDAARSESQLF